MTLHPHTIDLGDNLRVEHEFYNPCPPLEAFPSERFESWYRRMWDAFETGAHRGGHAWECGLGLEAAIIYAEQDASTRLAPVPGELAVVLDWLGRWADERRSEQAARQ